MTILLWYYILWEERGSFQINLWSVKVLETCFTVPRSIVWTTPLQNPFEGLSGWNNAPHSWVRLPALVTDIQNHGINFRSQRGLSYGETWKGSTKCHSSVWRLCLDEFLPTRDITWTSAHMFFKNKPRPFPSQETHFLLLEFVQGNSQFFIQFCANIMLVNSQLVLFDPGLTHTKGLRYNHPTCQALIKVVFPVGFIDPYLFCCSPAVS